MHQKSRGMALALGLVVGAVLTLTPVTGHTLGLGKLKVHSALNEPLNAEIEFTSISEKELKGLNASLASYTDFRAVGAERLPFLSQIKFTVAKRLDGRYFLQLQTDQQIEEPFLHLLIQLEWRGGRLVREYTALIDPPYLVAGKPAGIEVPRTAPSVKAGPPPVEPVPVAKVEEAPKVEPKPKPVKEAKPPKKEVAAAKEPAPAVPAEEALLGPSVREEAVISGATGWPEDFVSEEVASVEKEAPEEAPKVELLGPPIAEAEVPLPEAPAKAMPTWATTSEYAVKRGDTLWKIADKARFDKQLSMEQVILAIFKANKHAFFRNNVNNLKAGKILKIPERETVASIPGPQARREFRAQYDVWQEYKLKLASASRAIKVSEAVTQPETVKAEPKAEAKPAKPAKEAAKPAKLEEKAAQKKAESKPQKSATAPAGKGKQPDELLKIVRATLESEKAAPDKKVVDKEAIKEDEKKERTVLAERVTALEESLESKQMETKELGEKIGQVKSQIKKESRLIELENQGLAQAEKKAPEVKPETPAKPADKAKAEAPAEAPKPAPEAGKPVTAEKVAPVRKKRAAPPQPPKEEKNFITALIDEVLAYDSLLPLVGGVAVLIGGVIMLVYMRRRRRSIAEFEESILSDAITADTGDTGTMTSDTSGQAVTTGDTSFLSDFSQGGMGNIHTDEVDPIAEAEVYLAYGRDETAEEILKEAIVKSPERHELKQKLLEIYHQRNDVAAFETLAEELYAALGGRGGKVWDKVEEMGRKLNPENPMFRGGAPAKSVTADTDTGVSMPAPMMDAMLDVQTDLQTPSTPAKATETVVDMDFDVGTSEATTPAAQESPTRVSAFDLDLGAETAGAPSDDTGVAEKLGQEDLAQPADNAIEFDISESAPAEVTDVDVAATPADAGEDIKLDIEGAAPAEAAAEPGVESGAPTEEGQQQWDETATKLDLAKAYIDMGDAEGARSILDEVLAEGNEAQKQQAAELAAQIS